MMARTCVRTIVKRSCRREENDIGALQETVVLLRFCMGAHSLLLRFWYKNSTLLAWWLKHHIDPYGSIPWATACYSRKCLYVHKFSCATHMRKACAYAQLPGDIHYLMPCGTYSHRDMLTLICTRCSVLVLPVRSTNNALISYWGLWVRTPLDSLFVFSCELRKTCVHVTEHNTILRHNACTCARSQDSRLCSVLCVLV